MAQLLPVSKERHGGKYWKRYDSYAFARGQLLAPMVAAEIPKAALTMPLAFVRHGDRYLLIGMLSLSSRQNLFVLPDGKWGGGYVPSAFRSYPFRLAKAEGQKQLILCVDEDSGLIVDDKNSGEPFFDDSGKTSKPLQGVVNFLEAMEKSRKMTDVAVSLLAGAGVLAPWSIETGGKKLEGLYRTDEAALQKIDDGVFLKLRKAGALALAYSQLLSMGNLAVLERLAAIQEKIVRKEAPKPQISTDGEYIRFDQ